MNENSHEVEETQSPTGRPVGTSFFRSIRQDISYFFALPFPVVLLFFPTCAIFLTSVGFLFNISVSPLSFFISLALTLLLAFNGGKSTREGWQRVGWMALILFAIFAIDSFFLAFSWWDTQAYHLPASKFLRDGWNPIFECTRESLLAFANVSEESFNSYHVAYLPRGGWVWSAILGKVTGNLELGDSLTIITASVLGALAWSVTPLLFALGKWKRIFFTALVTLSPGVVASVFCGAQDGALYTLLLIQMFASCAYRKTGRRTWATYLAIAPIMGCNLKFNGTISFILIAAIFTIPVLWSTWRKDYDSRFMWRWILAHTIGFGFAIMVGFSPYLTNWASHGGPFYPQHSFNKQESLPAMTADFDLLNDDAAAMGYFGRVTNAYLSKWLAHRYYEWKLGKKNFHPVFHLDQVSGLGSAFRIVMLLTLLTLCFTRRCTMPWFLLCLVLTSFIIPSRFVGYVRYVPQFWMFPVLIAFNAFTVNTTRSPVIGRTLGLVVIACLATSSFGFALGKIVISIGSTQYSLSVINAMASESAPRAYVLSLHDRYREDGRCLAAWETLPKEIPSAHLFDVYYKTLLPELGVKQIAWQTPQEMRDLRASGAPAFYLDEHLWYWPTDPQKIQNPEMHYFAGPPRKPFTVPSIARIAWRTAPGLPSYCKRLAKVRLMQLKYAVSQWFSKQPTMERAE